MTIAHHTNHILLQADGVPRPAQGEWTYKDYVALPENGQRYEVVRGVLYMSPAPNWDHQGIAALILYHLLTHVQFKGRGQVRPAPLDVQLAENTIVQPDVLLVLNEHLDRIQGEPHTHVVGAPDLVVEIFSPRTAGKDRHEKRSAYEQAGVFEYWLVDPEARTLELLVLEQGVYRSLGVFRGEDLLPSRVAPDMPVHVEQFFASL